MPLNKYSSPEEVKIHHEDQEPRDALSGHISRFYPAEIFESRLCESALEKIIHALSTKAMETM